MASRLVKSDEEATWNHTRESDHITAIGQRTVAVISYAIEVHLLTYLLTYLLTALLHAKHHLHLCRDMVHGPRDCKFYETPHRGAFLEQFLRIFQDLWV